MGLDRFMGGTLLRARGKSKAVTKHALQWFVRF